MRFMVVKMKKIAYKERLMRGDFELIKYQLQGILNKLVTKKGKEYYIILLDNIDENLYQINYEIDKIERGDK